MFGHGACKEVYSDFLNCCYHEREVEMDKLRRDTTKHTEWYWLNLYDEDGEIGEQAKFKPEESLTGMWKKIAYNMFVGNKSEFDSKKVSTRQKC